MMEEGGMRHIFLVVCICLVFGAAAAADQQRPAIEVPESGPWAIEPVPVDTIILAMPLMGDGEYTGDGFHITRTLILQWQRSLARRMSVVPREVIYAQLEVNNPRLFGFPYPGDERVLERMKRMNQPTHVLTGSYEVDGDEWVIYLQFAHGDSVHQETVRAPVGEDVTAAAEISKWVLGLPVFDLSREEVQRLNRPYFGGLIGSFDGGTRLELFDNPDHPKWEEFRRLRGYEDLYRMERVWAAMILERQDIADELLGDAPPDDGHVTEYLARVVREELSGNLGGMIEEQEWLLARYPGLTRILRLHLWGPEARREHLEAYQRLFENWYARSDQSPKYSLWLGYIYSRIAWDYRGSGFSDTVSRAQWQKFGEYNDAAEKQLSWGLMEGGFQPFFVNRLLGIYGSSGSTRNRMFRLFDQVSQEYPEHSGNWSTLLNYLRPRWGGSIEEIVEMGERAMTVSNDNPNVLITLIQLHNEEAWFNSRDAEEKNQWGVVNVYFDRFPEARRQARRIIVKLMGNDVHESFAASGIYYAGLMNFFDTIADGIKLREDLYDVWEEYNDSHYYVPHTRRFFVAHYIHIGSWEEARKLIRDFIDIDNRIRQSGQAGRLGVVYQTTSAGEVDLALVEALLGNETEARQLLALKTTESGNRVNFDLARVILWDDPDTVLKDMADGARNNPQSDVHLQLHAIALAKSGNRAEARRVWERVENLGRDKWGPMNRLYEAELMRRR